MKQRARTVRPSDDRVDHNIYPVEGEPGDQGDGDEGHDGVAPEENKTELEEMAEKYEQLKQQVEMHFDIENQKEAVGAQMLKAPTKPTEEQWERHQATHTPFQPWCKHCQAARAVRRKHPSKARKATVVLDVERGIKGPVKISIDYMYLHERLGRYRNKECNPPQLIMVDHQSGRIWAYRTPNKGVLDEATWLPQRIVQDINNCGYAETKLQLKSDQEPAIVTLQTAIQELKTNVIPVNSPVGESESNGRVENAIRRVQEKIRTLRHQLETGIKCNIPDTAPIMAWLIRWAAEVISKYAPGDDGKTAYERLRNETCVVPVVPFGEAVMYLPMETAKNSKGEPAKKLGIWIGTIERTEETLIGTGNGIIKCRTVSRLPSNERWQRDLVLSMKGVPWEPVPGKKGQHILVEVNEDGQAPDEQEENQSDVGEKNLDETEEVEIQNKAHQIHISRKAIAKYGSIEGCPACNWLIKWGPRAGKLVYSHSTTCRKRIVQKMKEDPEYRRLVQKHNLDQEPGELEMITEAQVRERRHNIQKAILTIEDNMKQVPEGNGVRLTRTMLKSLLAKIEVAEIYSPPRVIAMAQKMGLRSGWALDITTTDVDGRAWDFNQLEMRNRAIRKVLKDEPLLLIGSPMCTAFSQLNNINYVRMPREEVEQRIMYGRKHLEFCTKLYELQWKAGRYFVHEHPASASSWDEQCIKRMLKKFGVTRVVADQCMYGLTTTDGKTTKLARKRIGFMTNSPCIATQLNAKCPNSREWKIHEHMTLIDGRPRMAQVYPPKFCQAICEGLKQQIKADRNGQFLLATMKQGEGMHNEASEMKKKLKTVEEEEDGPHMQEAWDDVSGAELNPELVMKARREEIEYVRKMNLYTKVPISQCYEITKKAPISIRWIDINKGDKERPNYRSRVVAREINTHKREDLFAATPPLEALKTIISITASGNKGERLMVNDVSRAFFHAKATRPVYVQLLEEDRGKGEEGLCGKLNYSMYGTRDAAQNWAAEYSTRLLEAGFQRGKASPCTFYHQERQIRTLVHGDDYVSVGHPKQLKWLEEQLKTRYQIKTHMLGPDEGQAKEIKILNRIISWHGERGITYEADPRHIEIVVEQLDLKESKEVTTPGTKEEGRTQQDCNDKLDEGQSSRHRAIVARCNYLSPDRPDISFSVKELARHMASPEKGNWLQLKRLGRYLKGRPRLQQWFQWQDIPEKMKTYSDADWAGCKNTRKSTTGGCVTMGKHTLKTWSKTQSLIALSSGESELYAMIKASAESLGMLSMLKDFGLHVSGEIWGDASAAIGMINRSGLGKTRHIETGLLWIQQTAAEKQLKYGKIPGKLNPADLFTKHLDASTMDGHVRRLEFTVTVGRAMEAPKLHLLSRSEANEANLCMHVRTLTDAMRVNKSAKRHERNRNKGVLLLSNGVDTPGRRREAQQSTATQNKRRPLETSKRRMTHLQHYNQRMNTSQCSRRTAKLESCQRLLTHAPALIWRKFSSSSSKNQEKRQVIIHARAPTTSVASNYQTLELGEEWDSPIRIGKPRNVRRAENLQKEAKDKHDHSEAVNSSMFYTHQACTGMDMHCALASTDILGDAAEGGCRDIQYNSRTYSLYKCMHVESGAQPAHMHARTIN